MIDKSKDTAKEWFFLYERGKLVGREEYEEKIDNLEKERDLLREENAKLRAENDRLRWTFEFLDKLEQFLEHKGLVGEYKEWKKEQSNYE